MDGSSEEYNVIVGYRTGDEYIEDDMDGEAREYSERMLGTGEEGTAFR